MGLKTLLQLCLKTKKSLKKKNTTQKTQSKIHIATNLPALKMVNC